VDPYYLTYKSNQLGYDSRVILAGRVINDEMPFYIARKIVQHVIRKVGDVSKARALVLGATFKENVSDIRNSKVADLVKELQSYSLNVDVVDPFASSDELKHEYGFSLCDQIGKQYDAIILAVAHDPYKDKSEDYFIGLGHPKTLFVDLKGIYRNKINQLTYWSL
jgi:UDP-N-acetyl-D-galactosamine dehydrogenase